MKNVSSKKMLLVTIGFVLGFSMLICSNYHGSPESNTLPNLKAPNFSQATDTYTLANVTAHVWSPDGTKLAYIKAPNGEGWNCELWVADKSPSGVELVNHQLIYSEAEYTGLFDWKDD
jgi:hypothetical protein